MAPELNLMLGKLLLIAVIAAVLTYFEEKEEKKPSHYVGYLEMSLAAHICLRRDGQAEIDRIQSMGKLQRARVSGLCPRIE